MRARASAGTRCSERGFTLIELLVVVAIIALLISIMLPALGRARSYAKEGVCRSSLHQLALATTYYADDNKYHLPYMLGTDTGSGKPVNAPYYQYHQIFLLWPYLKDLRIYKCPAAYGDNSVKSYPDDGIHSRYVVYKADDYYIKAYQNGWWPGINPNDYPGDTIDDLYTEYYFNDYSSGATDPATGEKYPAINGGLINKIAVPTYAVVIADGVWDPDNPRPRHNGANEFAFLDTHVERLPPERYYDPRTANGYNPADYTPRDFDPFRNRPFYFWGITREGHDATQ